jgi:glycerophosphoryl diester phosphodiesterase
MKCKSLIYFLLIIVFASCKQASDKMENFDVQGHRGARGLMPENSLPAFEKALDLGVTTLELDLAVTADRKLVVSHEPYFSNEICLDSTGNSISNPLDHNIFQMSYETVKLYDCGSIGNSRFPEQQKMSTVKPLLSEVFLMAEEKNANIRYNIEIKSREGYDGIYHPSVADFSDLVYRLVEEYVPWERVTIQSFDFRVLKYFNENYPEVQLVALIENQEPWTQQLELLGFVPEVYSPYFKLLNQSIVEAIHERGMKVIPWTVNNKEDMKELMEMGVDGIITDYPDRLIEIVSSW